MRNIEFIVLHCTGGPQTQSVETIRAGWRKLGWSRPGYHYLVLPTGEAVALAPFSQMTNGVAGFNARSIHIAYIGGVENGRIADNRTPAQKEKLQRLIEEAATQFPNAIIQGHRDFSADKNRNGVIEPHEWNKACPSFSVKEWLQEIGFKSKAEKTYRTTIARLNLRAGAGTNHPVLSVLERGTKVQFIGNGFGWSYVQAGTHLGWAKSEFLK